MPLAWVLPCAGPGVPPPARPNQPWIAGGLSHSLVCCLDWSVQTYQNKSVEELRYEDYQAGVKSGSSPASFSGQAGESYTH